MSKDLKDYNLDELRNCCAVWNMSTLKELSSRIRATIVAGEKLYAQNPGKYELWKQGEFLTSFRKESIVRNEMHKKIKLAKYLNKQNHVMQEKITEDVRESPFPLIQL